MQLIAEAYSKNGGSVRVVAKYSGSSADQNFWIVKAKVKGVTVKTSEDYATGFIDAPKAAQQFADEVSEELYGSPKVPYNDVELWAEMASEVAEVVTHYETDFTVHDKAFLANYDQPFFLWSVGDYGTHVARLPDVVGQPGAMATSFGGYRHFYANRKTGKLKQLTVEELKSFSASASEVDRQMRINH